MKKLLIAFLLLVTCISLQAQQNVLPDSLFIIRDSVLIPTKAGISISAIVVHKKEQTTALPAVLFYTTYYEGAIDANFGKRLANRDYVGIVAYARGIKTNMDNYAPYEHEASDVYDVIDWISKQPWCNGKVGMFGGSYTGFAQWSTVKKIHPALKTIVPQVAVMPGFDFPMENNVQLNLGLYWPNDNAYKREPIRRDLPFDWFEKGTSWKSLDSLAGNSNAIFQKWLQHPSYDQYWASMVPTPEEYAKINIPILTTTGYYDGSQISALNYFKLHTKFNKQANHYFVIGPYDHRGGQRRPALNLMGYAIDSIANVSMQELAFEWLDHILQNKPKPSLLKDKINYQVMGANEWKHAPTLQKINNDTLTFYLDRKNLVKQKPNAVSFQTQTVDFTDRQTENNFFVPELIFDTLDASNGLLFTSSAFEKEFLLNGSFTGNLFTTINKKDMDVSLALYEQMPDGKYFFLTRYVGRASYAKNNSRRQLLKPGTKEKISFDNTRFVSKKISKGSKLVILLNINKHPFEIINYGSGKEVTDETIKDAGAPLQIKWYNDSFIKVPVWIY